MRVLRLVLFLFAIVALDLLPAPVLVGLLLLTAAALLVAAAFALGFAAGREQRSRPGVDLFDAELQTSCPSAPWQPPVTTVSGAQDWRH